MDQGRVLNNISIASPCTANWDEMTGDEAVRFCGLCQLNVYNLSAMPAREAEALIENREGRLCIRYYQRQDGTVLTKDCPVGLRALHKRKLNRKMRLAGVAASLTLITAVGVFTVTHAEELEKCPIFDKNPSQVEMGDVAYPIHPPVQPPVQPPLMGAVVPPNLQDPPPPVDPDPKMGEINHNTKPPVDSPALMGPVVPDHDIDPSWIVTPQRKD